MKYLLLIMVMLLTTCTTDNSELVSKIVYNMIASTRTGNTARKTDMVLKYSTKYKLDPFIFTRLGIAESSFIHTRENWNQSCFGIFQISTNYWSHLPYIVVSNKYAKYLHRHDGTNLVKVLKFIEANTHAGAIVLRNYLDAYDGDYRKSLTVYGGFRGKYGHRIKQKEKYINKIMGE